MSIKYIVDLAVRTDYPPELALSALEFDRSANIFHLVTGITPENTYWTDWGGTYDIPLNEDAEIYFSQFLQKVTSRAALISTENSMLIEGSEIFINLPRKPWQYLKANTEFDSVQGYASTVKNENNPSDTTYLDSQGNSVRFPTRLLIPSVPNKISDAISGTSLQRTFNYTLINNDGEFDDTDENNFINTPTRIKRTNLDNSTIADFKVIRYGLFDHSNITGDSFKVTAADINRTLTESATRKFTTSLYHNLPNSTKDKEIPLGWGILNKVP